MGRDKATLVIGGRTLVQRAVDALVAAGVSEVVLVGAPSNPLPTVSAPVPVIEARDATEHDGPLRGIVAGLEAAHGEVCLIVGCDMPLLRPELLDLLATYAMETDLPVLPRHAGQPEGLCSAWPRSTLEPLRARLEAGERAVGSTAAELGARFLDPLEYASVDATGESFTNINTPEEFAAMESPHPGEPSGG